MATTRTVDIGPLFQSDGSTPLVGATITFQLVDMLGRVLKGYDVSSGLEEPSIFTAVSDNSGQATIDVITNDGLIGSTQYKITISPTAFGIDTVTTVVLSGVGSVPLLSVISDPVNDLKDNLTATIAPVATNDVNEGYSVGSRWIDKTSDKAYVCLDTSVGASVWTETTSAGVMTGIVPMFFAHNNGVVQSIPHNTTTLAALSTATFDTTGAFTGNRYTPLVAGKYMFTGSILFNSAVDQKFESAIVKKNGVNAFSNRTGISGIQSVGVVTSGIVDMNGSTDYIELYVFHNNGIATDLSGNATTTYLTGHLVSTKYII